MDPALALDAVFEVLGRPVVVLGSPPRTVRAVIAAPDEAERFASRQVLSRTLSIEIRAADMAGIGAGSRLLVDGAVQVVRGAPEYRDADRLVASLDTQPE